VRQNSRAPVVSKRKADSGWRRLVKAGCCIAAVRRPHGARFDNIGKVPGASASGQQGIARPGAAFSFARVTHQGLKVLSCAVVVPMIAFSSAAERYPALNQNTVEPDAESFEFAGCRTSSIRRRIDFQRLLQLVASIVAAFRRPVQGDGDDSRWYRLPDVILSVRSADLHRPRQCAGASSVVP